MRKLVALLAVACVASVASAQPYYLAGSMQGWDPGASVMTEMVAGSHYQITFTGLSGIAEFKVTDGTWDNAWPGSNAQNDMGAGPADLTVDFYPGPHADGWFPTANRVGFTDLGLNTWEIMGDFDGWTSPQATMTPLGGGMYSTSFVVATPGVHEFKFRGMPDWSLSDGFGGFDGSSGNAQLETTIANELVILEMDIPNGRYRVVPEPATLALLGLGGLTVLRRRR